MKISPMTYDSCGDYSYSSFLCRRSDIISNIIGFIKHGVGCKKLVEAFTPLFYNEHHLNVSHELDLKEDENAVECPYEDENGETSWGSGSDIWLKDFEINRLFDVDELFSNDDFTTECLFSLGWNNDTNRPWRINPVEFVLDSVKNDTWKSFRRAELFYVTSSLIQKFYLDGEKNSKNVFGLINDLCPVHQLMYFGDMVDSAKDIAFKCKIPFDEFLTFKNVAEQRPLRIAVAPLTNISSSDENNV